MTRPVEPHCCLGSSRQKLHRRDRWSRSYNGNGRTINLPSLKSIRSIWQSPARYVRRKVVDQQASYHNEQTHPGYPFFDLVGWTGLWRMTKAFGMTTGGIEVSVRGEVSQTAVQGCTSACNSVQPVNLSLWSVRVDEIWWVSRGTLDLNNYRIPKNGSRIYQ